jgi:hypothetical protein
MNMMLQEIKDKTNNIGSLVLFVKNHKEYLDFINSNVPNEIIDRQLSEKIYYLVNSIESTLNCECGEHLSFIGFKNGYRKTCGKKECFVKSRKETCIEKFGVDNPKKSKEILEKEKENILEKWGGKHYMKDENVREKFTKTMKENWGVEWAQQNDEIKEKSSKTWNENPEKDSIIKSRTSKLTLKSLEDKKLIDDKRRKKIIEKFGSYENFIKFRFEKIKESSLKKWGTGHHFSSPEIIKGRVEKYQSNITLKIKDILPQSLNYLSRNLNQNKTDSYIDISCSICNKDSNITRQLLVSRIKSGYNPCLNCNPILSGKSIEEENIYNFIKSIYNGKIIQGYKSEGKEIDIFLPELNLGFEYNGLYWHSELYKNSKFHLQKTKYFLERSINLIHIWEDDWLFKNKIQKSIISNKIGLTSHKIWARKCQIKEASNLEVRKFLEENHIQGFVGSKVKLGLYYNDELVSLMTFGNLRKSLGYQGSKGEWELLRFCNKIDTSVIGGASKLFNYFIENHKPKSVISFCDYSRSTGNLYQKLGFEFSHLSSPNYYYIVDGIRKHRFNYRKDKLVAGGADPNLSESQIMQNSGIQRIWDCGMQKWIFNLK